MPARTSSYIKDEYVLVIDVDGDEVEVTDDILKQFKKKEKTLTLVRSYSEDLRPSFDDDGVDRDRFIMLHTICQALAKKRTPVRVAEITVSASQDLVVYPKPGWSVLQFKTYFEIVTGIPTAEQRIYTKDALLLDHEDFPENTNVGMHEIRRHFDNGNRPAGKVKVEVTLNGDRRTLWLGRGATLNTVQEAYYFAMGLPHSDQWIPEAWKRESLWTHGIHIDIEVDYTSV